MIMVFPLLLVGAGIVGGLALLGKGAGVREQSRQEQAFTTTQESRLLGEQDIDTYAKSQTEFDIKDSPYARASNQTTNITITKSLQEQTPQLTSTPVATQTSEQTAQVKDDPLAQLLPLAALGIGAYLIMK